MLQRAEDERDVMDLVAGVDPAVVRLRRDRHGVAFLHRSAVLTEHGHAVRRVEAEVDFHAVMVPVGGHVPRFSGQIGEVP